MEKSDRNALIAFPAVVLVGAGVALAGSDGSAAAGSLPVFAICVAVAFAINWLAFIPAYLLQTERFFDITGSVTYVSTTILAVVLAGGADARSILLLVLVVLWAARLGTFLFTRIHKSGKDARFDDLKPSFPRFLNVWTLQGLWVTFTLAAALAAITSTVKVDLGVPALIGGVVWLFGFLFEVIADVQKRRFRADPANKDRFIASGLWSWSRHPNYFGEIVLWVGVAVIAAPVLRGWQWVTLISPVFVTLLLTRVSGIPMLERRADEKWGGEDAYERYKSRTSVLIPFPPSGGSKAG